jgi:hypothetical protein
MHKPYSIHYNSHLSSQSEWLHSIFPTLQGHSGFDYRVGKPCDWFTTTNYWWLSHNAAQDTECGRYQPSQQGTISHNASASLSYPPILSSHR